MLTSGHYALDTRIFYKEARTLARAGYEVMVVGPHPTSEEREAIRIMAVGHGRGRVARLLLTPLGVLVAALRARAGIYHFHDPELMPVGLLLRLFGKRVIYDIHEYTVEDIRSKEWIPAWFRPPVGRLVGALERHAVRRMDGVVVVNDHMAGVARRLAKRPDRVVSVYNFPDAGRFDGGASGPDREPMAIYVGALSKERGWETLLEAARRLRGSYPESRVWVIGYLEPSGVGAAYRTVEHWPRYGVHYGGEVSHLDVPRWLGRARVGLIPWLPTPNALRGTPVKLFEYMSAGLPVVAADFGYIQQIVRDAECGVLVRPGDPVELSDAIEALLRDPGAAAEMGERGRRAVFARYSWVSQASKLLSLYEAIGNGAS
jgi:glycosyltransferase involved in cell wall biosynthesis